MLNTYPILASLIIATLFSMAFAQEAQNIPEQIMTLEQAESLAFAQNIDVLTESARYQKASADYLASWSYFMPGASASLSWRRYDRDQRGFRNDDWYIYRDG